MNEAEDNRGAKFKIEKVRSSIKSSHWIDNRKTPFQIHITQGAQVDIY